jgi:hypothetical protein
VGGGSYRGLYAFSAPEDSFFASFSIGVEPIKPANVRLLAKKDLVQFCLNENEKRIFIGD